MSAIFKREFKAYFQSVIGWLFLAVTLCLYGLYFYVYNLVYGYPSTSNTLSAISFIFLITVPLLTMRILAEERKNKTDQMILTAPVSVGKVVAAKYLAMAAVYTIVIAVIAVTPLILSAFGTVAFGESYAALLGFWLYGLSCIAIGMFLSSLTESQVIAAVITFAALFVGYMMGSICGLISSSGNLLTKILGCYDLTSPLDNFSSGMFDLSGVIYYLTLIVLFLFLTVQSIQKRRWSMSVKKIGLGVFSTGMVAFAVALAVVVNLVMQALPTTITQLDATSNHLYSMTDDTKKMLSKLDEDVTIYVLAAEKSADETVAKTLERYKAESSHVKVVYKDPAKYPNFYQTYTDDTSVTRNSLIVVSDKRNKLVNYNKMYEGSYDSSYNYQTTGYDGEGQITSAIEYVTSDDMPVVYEIEGHGETSLSGNFSEVITKANITAQTINLLKYDEIPDDAKAVIINGSTSDFSKDDAAKIISYLQKGGKVLISTVYTTEDMTNFKSILEAYQVSLQDGIVVEGDKDHYYQQPYYLLPDIASSNLTTSASGGYVFAPSAMGMTYPKNEDSTESVDSTEDTTGQITYTPLLTTSDDAYVKQDVANLTTLDKEDGDINGPFTIGLDVQQKVDDDNTTELIIYSCQTMLTDDADQMVSGNNSALFSDAITNLVSDSGESTTVIPVKSYDTSTLTVNATVTMLGAIFGIVVIPALLLIAGIVIWVKRRKR
ncbi:MAG: Gldg family protein [Lachnospiraceae bacterium]|nr:Gldg family protein [Lachnospiraceae bacterium]